MLQEAVATDPFDAPRRAQHVWWQWPLVSLLGTRLALLLLAANPGGLLIPPVPFDEYILEPWRYLLLYGSFYAVLGASQWVVLRRSVTAAWWWMVGSVASAGLLYASVWWLFDFLASYHLVEPVRSLEPAPPFGVGGHVFAIVGQALVLWRWTRYGWLWVIGAPIVAVVAVISGIALVPLRVDAWVGINVATDLRLLIIGTLAFSLQGLLLTKLLRTRRQAGASADSRSRPAAPSA